MARLNYQTATKRFLFHLIVKDSSKRLNDFLLTIKNVFIEFVWRQQQSPGQEEEGKKSRVRTSLTWPSGF
jgi:hypothetical protein